MEKETKKYLIIGTAVVVSVTVGVYLWQKYGTQTPATDQNNADQSNQDELALLASTLESNAYAGNGGSAYFSAATVGAGVPQSLADEVLALEQSLGFSPTPSAPPSGSSGSSSGSQSPSTPTPAPTTPVSTTPVLSNPVKVVTNTVHEVPEFLMDGVTNTEGAHIA